MKVKIFYYYIFISFSAFGSLPIDSCGEYKARGDIVKNKIDVGYSLLVNRYTKSEYQLNISLADELKVSSFNSNRVEINFLLNKKSNGMKGDIAKILNIKKIPSAGIIYTKNSEIELIKKSDCSNEK